MTTQFKPITPAQIDWRDGMPYSTVFDDIYFSPDNGLDESMAVFMVGNALVERFSNLPEYATFVIGELGFGTGLNCLLAWQLFLKHAPQTARLYIYTTEKHPLTFKDLTKALSIWPELSRERDLLLSKYPSLTPGMHALVFDDTRVCIQLMLGDAYTAFETLLYTGDKKLEADIRERCVDAWFLDGFAPSKNTDMWCEKICQVMALLSKKGSTAASFSVAATVRHALSAAGFEVFKKPGFLNKRHRLEAVLTDTATGSSNKKYTPWYASKPAPVDTRKAMIVGAGLSGCFTAYWLSHLGFEVVLLDKENAPARGASGNTQAVLYPNFSCYKAPLTDWMLHAFLFAASTYQNLIEQQLIRGELNGILKLSYNAKTKAQHASLASWFSHYPDLGALLNQADASKYAGIELLTDALWVPKAGWLDSQSLCQYLLTQPNIKFYSGEDVKVVEYLADEKLWQVGAHQAPVLILANAKGAVEFKQTHSLPLKAFGGQMSAVHAIAASRKLKLPLCASGHVLPADEAGLHWMGASYHPGQEKTKPSEVDDVENLKKLSEMPINFTWPSTAVNHWAGTRVNTSDYLPLVGGVPREDEFRVLYQSLAKDSQRYIPNPGSYYRGLYLCAGFGSRGLTSIPLATYYLSTLIGTGCMALPRDLVKAISPARFLMKDICRK